jgi:hypothetical protein
MIGSPQTQNKAAITTVTGMQTNMLVQQDSWPPCLYRQLLVFIFGKDSWLQATAQRVILSVHLQTGLCSLNPQDHHLVWSSASTGEWGLRKQKVCHTLELMMAVLCQN